MTLASFVDGLATPYGLSIARAATMDANHSCVKARYRDLCVKTHATRIGHTTTDCYTSGWGDTDDYHDWAVGPVRR